MLYYLRWNCFDDVEMDVILKLLLKFLLILDLFFFLYEEDLEYDGEVLSFVVLLFFEYIFLLLLLLLFLFLLLVLLLFLLMLKGFLLLFLFFFENSY